MSNLLVTKETFEAVWLQNKEAIERSSQSFTKDRSVPDTFSPLILAENMSACALDLQVLMNNNDFSKDYEKIQIVLTEIFDKALVYKAYFTQLKKNGTI